MIKWHTGVQEPGGFQHVNRTTMNRWNAFLLYFGYSPSEVKDQKPTGVFKMVIEFALEYRTNRDKIVQVHSAFEGGLALQGEGFRCGRDWPRRGSEIRLVG